MPILILYYYRYNRYILLISLNKLNENLSTKLFGKLLFFKIFCGHSLNMSNPFISFLYCCSADRSYILSHLKMLNVFIVVLVEQDCQLFRFLGHYCDRKE